MHEHPFAQYIRALGKGKTGSRSLSRDEAREAMLAIMRGEVEEAQIGAFLMLLRVKEESPQELAGFVDACRSIINYPNNSALKLDFDWSSYAGKRRQPLWFLLSALLLAQNGYRVLMHGSAGHTAGRHYAENTLRELGAPIATDWAQAELQLSQHNFSFMPLAVMCPKLQSLIDMRALFGLRSPVHTLCRLLNPAAATTTLQSVFHPSYSISHHDAAGLLGEANAVVFKGDAGEVEYRPQANLIVRLWRKSNAEEIVISRRCNAPEENHVSADALRRCWESGAAGTYAVHAIVGTTAIALYTHGAANDIEQAFEQAMTLWNTREPLSLLS